MAGGEEEEVCASTYVEVFQLQPGSWRGKSSSQKGTPPLSYPIPTVFSVTDISAMTHTTTTTV